MTDRRDIAWTALMPGLFVLLWSTGFLGAKFGLPHAEPLTFLLIRFALVCAILLPVAMLTGAFLEVVKPTE